MLAPAGTPRPIINKLHHELVKIIKSPESVTRLAGVGAIPIANTPEEFAEKLCSEAYDMVLADYRLPGWSGTDALEILRQRQEDMPFVLVTGTMGEEVAIETLKSGATDYVLKTRLSRLIPAVHRALREARERAERRQAQEKRRELQEVRSHCRY